jgi:hypothetical protein
MRDKSMHFQKNYFTRKNVVFKYATTIFELAMESIILVVFTIALNSLLLNLAKMFWYSYKSTQVGLVFLQKFGNKYQFFVEILNRELWRVSFDITIAAFIFCLVISSGCQLLYAARFFHCAKSFLHKLIYWGLPLTVLVSYCFYLWPMYPTKWWGNAYILYLFSTLCVFNLCFKISDKLIPEIGAIFKGIHRAIYAIVHSFDPVTNMKSNEIKDIEQNNGSKLPSGA